MPYSRWNPRPVVSKTCPICGVRFETPRAEAKVCSLACRRQLMAARNRSDPVAQAERAKLGGAVRGAQISAMSRPSEGYVRLAEGLEHRVVAAAVLGRPLDAAEVVHHEDQNKRNNHPFNLIVFPTTAAHTRHHGLGHCGLDACDCGGIRLKEVMSNV